MTDDELRTLVARAHDADRPPPLTQVLARRRPPRPAWLLPGAGVAAVAVALAVWLVLPRRAPPPRLDLAWAAPTDFLLDVPGTDLLRGTPRIDLLKGTLP